MTESESRQCHLARPLLKISSKVKTPGQVALCLAWLLAAGAGAWHLMRYENTPTGTAMTPRQWPAESRLSRGSGGFTLLMFAHPYCPCSRASIEELNRLLVHCRAAVNPHVLFVRPPGVTDDWTKTSLRKRAATIPGVKVELDPDGREARLFGAESSGHVVLFDPAGRLLFSGGITAARGHAGDNTGEDAVIALINGQDTQTHHADVFGCSLLDSTNSAP
jgi:hypothetical protein